MHWLGQLGLGSIQHLSDPIDHLVVARPNQFANFFHKFTNFFHNQTSYNAPPVFALLLKPLLDLMLNLLCDPLIEKC
jgi:hypothetical protein